MKRTWWSLTLTLALLVGLLWTGATPVRGAGFIVDNGADDLLAHDATPGDCLCVDKGGACTLRAAIEEANACAGSDTITFQTAMSVYVDATEGALPQLNEAVTIDASSVWDTVNDAPGIMINGSGMSAWGLGLGANSCEIYGLYITAFNGGSAIYVFSASNTIGGTGDHQRNVLSGNGTGLTLTGSSAQSNVVQNNYIGLTPAGNTKNPNQTGVLITGGASGNTIGGDKASYANFISGNSGNGVMIEMSGTNNNWLGNNAIGLGADLITDLGNTGFGVRIQNGPNSTVIGGTDSGNWIVYNGNHGVTVASAGSNTQITYNIIGGNSGDGVSIWDTSGCAIGNNIVNGNGIAGVRVDGAAAAGNLIWPNSITGNGFKGITLQNGGNGNIAAPTITKATSLGASGSGACAGCTVAVYSDAGDQGQVYHGVTTAKSTGQWSYTGLLAGPNITATTIDGSNNTSEFSAPLAMVPTHIVFLPLVVRNR